jgi:hypothetical protein
VAAPLSDFIVGLDALRAWRLGTDPMRLLRPTGLIVYPVKSGDAVRSSVTLKKQDSGWQAVGFGAPALSQALVGARDSVAQKAHVPESGMFQVRIPAFNLVFVAYVSDGRLMLTPVADAQPYGLTAGVYTPDERRARKILARVEQHAHELGVGFTTAKIVNNRYRWGSCTVNDNVNFNWRLIKAPMFVIDYVIVHELAHLIEANHTSRFWSIVRANTFRMEKAKAWLKEHGQILEEEI